MNRNKKNFNKRILPGTFLLMGAILFSAFTPAIIKPGQEIVQGKVTDDQNNPPSANIFYVYKDGEFKEAVLSKEPEMIGGKDLMETLIKLNMRYPEKAKEMKLGGTVVVSVVIDESGRIDDAFIHEGIGGGCNDEALRAVRLMDKVGFEPGEFHGRPVIVKFDIPITFVPQ